MDTAIGVRATWHHPGLVLNFFFFFTIKDILYESITKSERSVVLTNISENITLHYYGRNTTYSLFTAVLFVVYATLQMTEAWFHSLQTFVIVVIVHLLFSFFAFRCFFYLFLLGASCHSCYYWRFCFHYPVQLTAIQAPTYVCQKEEDDTMTYD